MQLISCDIENFGKMSHVHFDFTEGCNIICQENGWGKSTLAAFIRVMFFGFENSNARDDITNERKRYSPWQGGVYGGKIFFEAWGHKYILSRTFAAKEKDDIFSLRDAETNLETDVFSSDIGTDIFKIDGKSFLRSVYISQNDCDTEVTDSINAKLGNLAENTDDINNFEKVDKNLKDILNRMSPTRSTGSLRRLKDEITRLEQDIRQGEVMDRSMEELGTRINSEKERYKELKVKQTKLQGEKAELSRIKDNLALKEKYTGIMERYNQSFSRLKDSEKYFNGNIPDENELANCINKAVIVRNNENEIARCRMTEHESDKLESYREEFGNEIPTEAELDRMIYQWGSANDKKNTLTMKRDNLEFKRSMLSEKRKGNPALIIAGAVMAVAGVGIIFIQLITGIILIAAGLIGVITGLVIRAGHKSKTLKGGHEVFDFAREEEAIIEDEKFIKTVEQETGEFLQKYGKPFEEYTVAASLNSLRNEREEYVKLLEKEKENKLLAEDEEIVSARKEIDAFVKKYYNNISYNFSDISEKLYELKSALHRYLEYVEEFKCAEKLKITFEAEHNIEAIISSLPLEESDSMEKIDAGLNEITEELEHTYTHILEYTGQMEKMQDARDEISAAEEKLKEHRELFQKERDKYRLLGKTKELLGEAKVSFTRRYMEPIMTGFNKYYCILTGLQADRYFIDANTRVTVEEAGIQRDRRYLSAGYRDLTGICMRMALVDAMYQEEKPFIIFDDPFVNLDTLKVRGGMDLLKEIGKEYQVIYFTCHSSRAV